MDAYATAVVPNVYHNTIVVIDGARTHDMDLGNIIKNKTALVRIETALSECEIER